MVYRMEANVVDEELLAQALVEEEADGRDKIRTAGLTDLIMQALSLRLSFRHIRKIDNLQGFRNLTRLCLDNNKITTMENLDFLVNLTWLDLSFNAIEKIEGLDKLTKLTDLTLFNNRIREIEGLDHASDLQCLSMGNNHISSFDSIIKLRRFEKLRLLNLEGNPVCKEIEYRMMGLAYLTHLRYLDYSMVHKEEIVAAREQFQSELIDLEKKDAIERDKAHIERQAAQVSAQASQITTMPELKAANLHVIETLFNDMFREDAEMNKLKYLPGIQDLIDHFRVTSASVAEVYKSNGLVKYAAKTKQIGCFESSVHKLRDDDVAEQRRCIEDYTRNKKHVFKQLCQQKALSAYDLDPLRRALDHLYDQLLALEVQHTDNFEDLIGEFEGKYGELKTACVEQAQGFFRAVEEQEGRFTQSLINHINELLEKASSDGLPEDLAEEAETLLMDRDSLMEIVSAAHDNRVSVVLRKEDESRAREETGYTSLVSRYREETKSRNRHRILELHELMERNKKHMADLVTRNTQEDFDEPENS